MPATAGPIIANSMNFTINLGRSLLTGIETDRFARHARVGGTEVAAMHPAFAYGHLSLYPAKCLGLLEVDASEVTPSARFSELFEGGVECVDDPAGDIYPPMDEVTDFFFRSHERLQAAVREASDEQLAEPYPDEARRDRFPTAGAVADFLGGGHAMFHLGQVSTWRRCEGLGSAM